MQANVDPRVGLVGISSRILESVAEYSNPAACIPNRLLWYASIGAD